MDRIRNNWNKEEEMNRTRRHGDYKEVFYRHKENDSIIEVSKNHGPAAMDDGTHGVWFVRWDKHGSGIYGTKRHFDNKDQAVEYAKYLARNNPEGFEYDNFSIPESLEREREAEAEDIRRRV
jgi:hypothetical protein